MVTSVESCVNVEASCPIRPVHESCHGAAGGVKPNEHIGLVRQEPNVLVVGNARAKLAVDTTISMVESNGEVAECLHIACGGGDTDDELCQPWSKPDTTISEGDAAEVPIWVGSPAWPLVVRCHLLGGEAQQENHWHLNG